MKLKVIGGIDNLERKLANLPNFDSIQSAREILTELFAEDISLTESESWGAEFLHASTKNGQREVGMVAPTLGGKYTFIKAMQAGSGDSSFG